MARALMVLVLSATLCGCGASAVQLALKALEVAISVAREVHDHHLDGGTVCPTSAHDAGVVE